MPVSTTAPPDLPDTEPRPTDRARTRILDVSEVRWALAATALFLLGLLAHLVGAPAWTTWALCLGCYLAGGWEPALEGLRALRERTLDVDLLMIVAALGAAAIGQIVDGALLIVIFATSGALEAVLTRRTADSIRGLLDLSPDTAVLLHEDGSEHEVDAADLHPGDIVIVRPGERLPGDGTVVEGSSDVDQSSITGEPVPAVRVPGDEVFAGTINGTGSLRVRIDADPSATVIARIVSMVEHASTTKARTQLFIEKVEQYYSTTVVVATTAVFVVPLVLGSDVRSALLRAMTFMIVASPCAVVLATMPPLLAAMATAGRHGVLVKSAVVMEQLRLTNVVAFDKTGTLTEGRPHVEHVVALGDTAVDEILRLAAAAESGSEHPLGRAIVECARQRTMCGTQATEFESTPGAGVRALIGGVVVSVARPDGDLDPATRGVVAEHQQRGTTAVVVRVDGHPIGVITLLDTVRAHAAQAVTTLERSTGHPVVLLTGDNHLAARATAGRAGISDVRADLLPEDKVEAVHRLRDGAPGDRHVLVVGDGVNDAPALAAADTGIAMGRRGSDLALDTADAVLIRDDLGTLATVIELSRRAHRIVVANLVIAASFIVVLVAWDLVGTLPLPVGVAGHETSTVIVALNGMRLLSSRAWRRSAPA
ncbi:MULTISPECIES: heavy metal translocating P-type ATPase [Nocardiaceae]|nr:MULTISPECIES: heavy metal translocating P-type ATPase [Rhodococcus]